MPDDFLWQAAFDDRFPARFRNFGLLADRPATPEGNGDTYYASDTNELYVGSAGAWVKFQAASALSTVGKAVFLRKAATQAIGSGGTLHLTFDTEDFDDDSMWPGNGEGYTIKFNTAGRWHVGYGLVGNPVDPALNGAFTTHLEWLNSGVTKRVAYAQTVYTTASYPVRHSATVVIRAALNDTIRLKIDQNLPTIVNLDQTDGKLYMFAQQF